MTELRWILLGLGAMFCAGLWWWETRRRRQAVDSLKDLAPLETDPDFDSPYNDTRRSPLPRMEPSFGEAVRVEETVHDIEPLPVHAVSEQTFDTMQIDEDDEDVAEAETASDAGDMTPDEIVSLRLLAMPDKPFEGGALVKALLAAGLEHGKFSIFHKYDVDGRTLFSVASMVEPGSFDLENIDGRHFRGITFFTLTKSSGEAGLLSMKLAAQDLARRLQGTVQEGPVQKDTRN